MRQAAATLSVVIAAGAACGQVVISEVFENPPGAAAQNDAVLEYIELYGEPGTDLTGWAVALINGGTDADGDGFPGATPEVDEAFSLDGLVIGDNGFCVVYNGTPSQSLIPAFLPVGATSVSFFDAHIPSVDVNGNLSNDGSSTFVLVRGRPDYSIVNGASVYGPAYAFRKDVAVDVDFDSNLDFGDETPVIGLPAPARFEAVQIVDAFAWSNAGGKEYTRSGEHEISETAGFNPDAVSRVAYYGANPMLGMRVDGNGDTVPTRMADEELIYGEVATLFSYDGGVGTYGGPTDPTGDGFQDVAIAGFELTPGGFNDSASAGITQFRFVRGDFDFDGDVDAGDGSAIAAKLGQSLDERTPCLGGGGQPIVIDGDPVLCWVYEGRAANALLAMMNMDKTDGAGGSNADVVTQADLDAWNADFGPSCPADLTGEGDVNTNDFFAFLALYQAMDPRADFSPGGGINTNDFFAYLAAYQAGC